MYEFVVLTAVLIGILWMTQVRERLEPTDKIKPFPQNETEGPIELENRWNMLDDATKQAVITAMEKPRTTYKLNPAITDPTEKAKLFVMVITDAFYNQVYKPATQPITEADIGRFIQVVTERAYPFDPRRPMEINPEKEVYTNGTVKNILMTYFMDQPAPQKVPPQVPETPTPDIPPPPPPLELPEMPAVSASQTMPPELQQVLNLYKTNYIEYRATGRAPFKTAYQTAEKYIIDYLNKLRSKVEDDAKYVSSFLDNYGTAHSELDQLQGKMKTIRSEAPKMEDAYLTIKREEELPVDYTQYYVKGAILAGVIGVIIAVSFF